MQRFNYTCHIASNIEEAKNLIASQKINLLLCDGHLKDGDAFKFLTWVQTNYPSIAQVFMSGDAERPVPHDQPTPIMDLAHLEKPFTLEALKNVVASTLAKSNQQAEDAITS